MSIPTILLNKTHCNIIDEFDTGFIKALDKELSFWIQGAEYSKAFKGYIDENTGKEVTWNGCHKLLSSRLRFPAGLLSRVCEVYERFGKSYQLKDVRGYIEPTVPINVLPRLETLGKIPYDYQLQAVDIAKNKTHGVIKMPTGAGKTLVAALLTASLGKTTIIYVIGKDLLYQLHKLFSSVFDEEIGIVGDGKCEIRDINIATIWTVGQALGLSKNNLKAEDEEDEKKPEASKYKDIRDMLARTKVHILDECHLAATDTVQAISKRINPENVYGMSASPWRDDGADLLIEAFLGPRIINISAKELISGGYLVPPTIKFLAVPRQEKQHKQFKTIYKNYVTDNSVRNNMIVTGARKLVEQGFQTLILFHSIKHGDNLYKAVSKYLPCEILSGKDDSTERELVKQKLEGGKINCVLASKIFDIGIDVPSLSGLIIAGGGKSSVRALQRIGRVIRRYPGKTHAAVIDFADQAPYLLEHSKIRNKIYSEEFDVIWPEEKEKQPR